jgi:2,3,4,5-tetrahydropyridine-2-carboxylate N-succinyltransferase
MSEQLSGGELLDALESGELRVAERGGDGNWIVNAWVKEEILQIFRTSPVVGHFDSLYGPLANPLGNFVDKEALPVRRFYPKDHVRIVPGGSSVRRGAHLAPGVIAMPPMYVNVGAYVGVGTMIDSHALVGSCAQIGERVHLSAAAQIGGVLEPAQARPVIVEDEAFIGGGCGIYEGVLVRKRAVLSAGVVLTASTRVFDLVHERELTGSREHPLEIPEGAVVVPGTRPATSDFARQRGLQIHCALIVKYRDAKTDSATALEQALRG